MRFKDILNNIGVIMLRKYLLKNKLLFLTASSLLKYIVDTAVQEDINKFKRSIVLWGALS
ncbi:hypothetical protein CUB90_20990 [Clostridium sp. CT7]|uniref:hypothetical protein n=2 Tax=Clostridium TaxID=1485 RepID=UPI000824AD0F|nr:hypothetical protein [Clostridium sp. CT7]PJI10197.1 hypothetical protein CUB90_20990 [Clostridium sp. CT7]